MHDARNPWHSCSKRGLATACALFLALQFPCGLAGCSHPITSVESFDDKPASSASQQEPEPTESDHLESQPTESTQSETQSKGQEQSTSLLTSSADIGLHAVDDEGQYYAFTYGNEAFGAYYEPDTWKVYDSYKITNHDDIVLICQALLDEHPIHGSDMESFRDAQDMAYEWQQHNIAFELLPVDSSWRESAQSVDLDPDDQGKSFAEMYASRRNT